MKQSVKETIIANPDEQTEPLICTLDGFAYYLGPQAENKMAWAAATNWCAALGDGYELPTRIVLFACYANKSIREEFATDDWYWTAEESEFYATFAWKRSFSTGYQGSYYKATANYVRAVRKVLI